LETSPSTQIEGLFHFKINSYSNHSPFLTIQPSLAVSGNVLTLKTFLAQMQHITFASPIIKLNSFLLTKGPNWVNAHNIFKYQFRKRFNTFFVSAPKSDVYLPPKWKKKNQKSFKAHPRFLCNTA
jgi:hypothetical protein